jgi:hypothetical protein
MCQDAPSDGAVALLRTLGNANANAVLEVRDRNTFCLRKCVRVRLHCLVDSIVIT